MPEAQADEVKENSVPSVEKGCLALVNARVSLIGNNLGALTFTRSPQWGHVVRIDIGEPNPSRYSRIVCFQRENDPAVQMGLYDVSKSVCDGHFAGVSFTAITSQGPATPNPPAAFRTLNFLPSGRVQFDDGPAISLKGLRSEIIRMAREHDCRDVHLNTASGADYSHVAQALKLFQRYGCNDLGFRGYVK